MPRYLIIHPKGQSREDILIEAPDLTLTFEGGWAILADEQGPALAVPCGQGASIQRVDEPQDEEPAPQKE